MHITEIGLAFLEGLVLIASPCILPVLPLVLSGAVNGGKQRPYGIIFGFIMSFSAFALLAHQIVNLLHIPLEMIRNTSLVILCIFSLLLIFPSLWEKCSVYIKTPTFSYNKEGFLGGVGIGILIGFIWTPCAGPIMAAALVQIIRQQSSIESLWVLIAFAIGVGIPMLFITLAGKELILKTRFITKHIDLVRIILGLCILLSVAYMIFGGAPIFTSSVNEKPKENITYSQGLIAPLAFSYAAPEFKNIETWLNSPPLTMASLKGKVVLIDFWTYSCINCIRTLPYLRAWDQKYRDKGLVIVGVHAPEFEFEKNSDNVKMAVKKYQLTYPIALDNTLSTWDNFHNRYWPAHYLIDKEGNVVYTHFGEGAYEITEQNINTLLKLKDSKLTPETNLVQRWDITPETYLGSLRRTHFIDDQNIPVHHWTLKGQWRIEKEKIISLSPDASIQLHFQAKKVFLVMGSENQKPILVDIVFNGKMTSITVSEHRLYDILSLEKVENGVVEIRAKTSGLEAYAFTFGD